MATVSYKTFSTNDYGFTIEYPDQWPLEEPETVDLQQGVVSFRESTSTQFSPAYNVNIAPVGPQVATLDQFTQYSISHMKELFGSSLSDVKIADSKLSGLAGKLVTYTAQTDISPIQFMIKFTLKDQFGYVITFNAPEDQFERVKPIAEHVFDSFTIMPDSADRIMKKLTEKQPIEKVLLVSHVSSAGFQLWHPSNWTKAEKTNGVILKYDGPLSQNEPESVTLETVVSVDTIPGITLDSYIPLWRTQFCRLIKGELKVKRIPATLGGVEGYQCEIMFGEKYYHHRIVVRGEQVVVFGFTSNFGKDERVLQLLDVLTRRFTFEVDKVNSGKFLYESLIQKVSFMLPQLALQDMGGALMWFWPNLNNPADEDIPCMTFSSQRNASMDGIRNKMSDGAVKMQSISELDLSIEGMEEGKIFKYKGETQSGVVFFMTIALRPIGSERLYDFTYWASTAKYSVAEKAAVQIASSFRTINCKDYKSTSS